MVLQSHPRGTFTGLYLLVGLVNTYKSLSTLDWTEILANRKLLLFNLDGFKRVQQIYNKIIQTLGSSQVVLLTQVTAGVTCQLIGCVGYVCVWHFPSTHLDSFCCNITKCQGPQKGLQPENVVGPSEDLKTQKSQQANMHVYLYLESIFARIVIRQLVHTHTRVRVLVGQCSRVKPWGNKLIM